MCPVPPVVKIPLRYFEKVTLKTSCEKALVLRTTVSCSQSHIVIIKSGAPPCEANKVPFGLRFKLNLSLIELN